ncbi:MAG: hypothetical protein PHF56_06950 [Desulfuromonadaceae bacterium]|nr:hypothetical protein [Desulfuromonadaceae bacterium]
MSRMKLMLWTMTLMLLSGCAESSALIKANSTSIRTDIYEELTNGGIAPQGFADLRITASLKTHKPGIYSASDIHGTPDYKLLLNIDGQAMMLQGNLQKENSEPIKLADPEAGNGIRYRYNNNLRLKAGTHRIVVALPDDGIAVEREITLTGGSKNRLVLEPIYSTKPGMRRPGAYRSTSFKEGVRTIRLVLNGREI